jgi:glycosyltransferase involved in cell wall biosynthesis
MIGSGTLLRALEDLIVEFRLQEKVLLAGDLPHAHTLKVLSSSHIYIRASRYDGDCLSLKEALHLGVPAIASNTGLRPEGTILFPIGDEEALIDRIVTTASTPPKGGRIGQDDSVNLAEVEKILFKLSLN